MHSDGTKITLEFPAADQSMKGYTDLGLDFKIETS